MAERPIFIPTSENEGYIKQIDFNIPWAGGFADIQKQRNITSLHNAARQFGYSPILEVSSKSDVKAGRHLSAFHLRIPFRDSNIPLENAFQGSKVFQNGGPFTDLYNTDPREAKRDPRLRTSGDIVGFQFENMYFPIKPRTVFYDWLYLSALFPHREWLIKRITVDVNYAGYTDIEFNPTKSINCQAKSCALFVVLMREHKFELYMKSSDFFISKMSQYARDPIPHDAYLDQKRLINV